MKYFALFGCLVLWFCSISSVAAASFDFSGFATLTAGYNSSDEIGFSPNFRNKYHTDWSLARDSSIGGQLNIDISSQWDAVSQVVLQDRHILEVDNYLEIAFLRYRPTRNWSIRLGRMSSDVYLLSEYTNVSNAYLWVRPPQEFYSFASSVGNFDGIDFEYSDRVGDGFLQIKLATGATSNLFEVDGVRNEVNFANLWTLSASYQIGNFSLGSSYTRADFDEYQGGQLDVLITGLEAIPPLVWSKASKLAKSLDFRGKMVEFSAIGLAYDTDEWIIQSELGLNDSDWLIAPSTLGGYISVGRKFDDITLFGIFAGAKSVGGSVELGEVFLPDDLPADVGSTVSQLRNTVEFAVNSSINHQNSISIGAKWYAASSFTLKAQLDHYTIFPFGGISWSFQELLQTTDKHHVNIFSVSANMVF